MKIYKFIKTLTVCSVLFYSPLNIYANSVTFISANDSGIVDVLNTSIISSQDDSIIISKLQEVASIYQLSVSEANTYISGKYAVVVSSDLVEDFIPVYSELDTESDIIGQLPVESMVIINSSNDKFSSILYNDSLGYIENKYIQTTGHTEDVLQENQNIQGEKAHSQILYARVISETGLNLREDSSIDSKVIKILPFDTFTTILENQGSWLKVKTSDGQEGYISSEYIVISETMDIPQAEQIITNYTAQEIVDFAKSHIGIPYVYGGTNLNTGTDCSGFTYAVFKNFGINLNRTSRDQYLNGVNVEKSDLLPGDLVFFNTGGSSDISHVGIYIGNDEYIHSTDSKNQGVTISSLNSSYSFSTYYGARRILN